MDIIFHGTLLTTPWLTFKHVQQSNKKPIQWIFNGLYPFPICHWQHFWEEFLPPPIPGTVTSVKFPFIIITSVECSFIKPWMPVLYSGTLSQGDLPSNDCYKTLSLWDKLDDRGGENKMANKPLYLRLPCGNFLSLKTYSSRVRLCFSAVDCISLPADKRGEKFTNQQVLYLWLHLLYLKLVSLLKKA